jgi:hypothetical protein
MRAFNHSAPPRQGHPRTWWSRVGITGVAFFLLKGVLWLLAPALIALMR